MDASNIARIAEFEQQRAEENLALQQEEQEADRPQYAMNDLVMLRDENGIGIRGNITADVDAVDYMKFIRKMLEWLSV